MKHLKFNHPRKVTTLFNQLIFGDIGNALYAREVLLERDHSSLDDNWRQELVYYLENLSIISSRWEKNLLLIVETLFGEHDNESERSAFERKLALHACFVEMIIPGRDITDFVMTLLNEMVDMAGMPVTNMQIIRNEVCAMLGEGKKLPHPKKFVHILNPHCQNVG